MWTKGFFTDLLFTQKAPRGLPPRSSPSWLVYTGKERPPDKHHCAVCSAVRFPLSKQKSSGIHGMFAQLACGGILSRPTVVCKILQSPKSTREQTVCLVITVRLGFHKAAMNVTSHQLYWISMKPHVTWWLNISPQLLSLCQTVENDMGVLGCLWEHWGLREESKVPDARWPPKLP